MIATFTTAAIVTLITTALAITRANPVHAVLYFVISLLGMGVIFYTMGAPFAAALEVIVYAGAIMVLFLFVIMMLALDSVAAERERDWMARPVWVVPVIMIALLGVALIRVLPHSVAAATGIVVTPQAVGIRLFTSDLSLVELASMLLLAGLVAAFHLGRKTP
jgi:NADH-quinone oxidoreductase subunit J